MKTWIIGIEEVTANATAETVAMRRRETWFEEVEKTMDQFLKIYQIKVKVKM